MNMDIVHSSTPQRKVRQSVSLENLPSPIINLNRNQQINNDELERSIRRSVVLNRKFTQNYVQSPIPSEKDIREHFHICLKMYAENRISAKNVWNLKLIDYMKNVLISKTQNTNKVLQMASTSLDVGTKIYGLRVDDIHSDGLKLASNVARTNQEEDVPNNEENIDNQSNKPQKRRKLGQQPMITKNPESLLENVTKVKSTFFQVTNENESTLTSNLFTLTLPMHYHGHKFILLNTERKWRNGNIKIVKNSLTQKYPFLIKSVKPFNICQPFEDFEIDRWDLDTENEQLSKIDNEVLLDPETEPIYELDQTLHNSFDHGGEQQIEDDALEYITNFNKESERKVVNNYSFTKIILNNNKIINRMWAGPSHWKLKYIQPISTKFAGNVKKSKNKPALVTPELINFEFDEPVIDKTKLHKPKLTKSEFDPIQCTLPQKIFVMNRNRPLLLKPLYHCKTHDSIILNSFIHESDLNENNSQNSYDQMQNNVMESSIHEEMGTCQQREETDFEALVELPEMISSTYVPAYATKDKQMNMKKLKQAIWKTLTETKENGNDKA